MIGELSNPGLDFSRHREQVNDLVINLVIKYLCKYLQLSDDDFQRLQEDVRLAIANSPEDIVILMTSILIGYENGETIPLLSEKMALQCLVAIRETAAIFKEIAFNDQFSVQDNFIGVDYGSGTGILMVASLIAARRQRIRNVGIYGFDLQEDAVRNSNRVLGSIDGDAMRTRVVDVTNLEIHHIFDNLPLAHWVSETFGCNTSRLFVDGNRICLDGGRKAVAHATINLSSDPFEVVACGTAMVRPSFVSDVKACRTAMFPDLINGLYRPDFENSVLGLRTAITRQLLRPLQKGA